MKSNEFYFGKKLKMLSSETISYIFSFYPYNKNISNASLYDEKIIKPRKQILDEAATKIKKWWKYYTPDYMFDNKKDPVSMIANKPILLKKILVKFYIFKYQSKYLNNYPEFYLHANFRSNEEVPLNILENYNTFKEQKKRRTFTIYKFLKLNEVSPYQLITTGW